MSDQVKVTKATYNKNQVNVALTAMANLRDLIRGFFHVKNPVGQAFQRYFDSTLEGKIKVKGRKTSISVLIPKLWCVAVDPTNNRRVKGAGSKFLKALQAKHVSDSNAVPLIAELLTYFASKLITSQDQKFEGALMAQIVQHLESEGNVQLESLKVGEDTYTREQINTKLNNQLRYLQVLIDAGIAPEYRRQSTISFNEEVPLL